MRIKLFWAATAAALSLALPSYAQAEEHGLEVALGFGTTVSEDVMAAQRGKAVLTIMDLDGTVQDNAALNNVTGHNIIRNGSFVNSSGITTTIQNSGNNVLIQNATILQLDLR
jgi:hypothetical protein